jgi:outer membrane protein OmpA-like peptidoglycan-associated protein
MAAKSADAAKAKATASSAASKKATYGGSSKDTSVNFGTNKFNLTTAQKNELNRMAAKINKTGVSRVTLRGHADSRGGVDNMALSKNRAKATADYLKSKVKNPDVKFVITAASIKEPIASNKTVKGMSSNRRVDIILPAPRIKAKGGAPLAVGKGRGPFGGSADKTFG